MVGLIRVGLAALFTATLVGAPYIYWRLQQCHYRNLRVVTPNVLYRSGQLDEAGLREVLSDHGIRTVITLRQDDGSDHVPSRWEEEFLIRNHIKHIRIPVGKWRSDYGRVPAAEAAEKFIAVMRNPDDFPRPILVHCFAGIHRTGGMCAIYRMEFDGWPVRKAMKEMKELGYTQLDDEDDISGVLLNYQPSWKKVVVGQDSNTGGSNCQD